jgi:hypothetical protein
MNGSCSNKKAALSDNKSAAEPPINFSPRDVPINSLSLSGNLTSSRLRMPSIPMLAIKEKRPAKLIEKLNTPKFCGPKYLAIHAPIKKEINRENICPKNIHPVLAKYRLNPPWLKIHRHLTGTNFSIKAKILSSIIDKLLNEY